MKTHATSSTASSRRVFCFTRLGLACLLVVSLTAPAHGANTFENTGALATARTAQTTTLLPHGKVLIAGGLGASPLTSAELYDPATGLWTATGALATARYYHTATMLPNGRVLVAGGINGGVAVASAEIYDPATGLWSATGALATGRYTHSATLLSNGKVLVAGGINGGVAVASAEIYDPATGLWSATGALAAARQSHSATLLPSGKVLVAGGYGTFTLLGSSELYDPAGNGGAGSWTATGALAAARYLHSATLLPSGKVLVAGGEGSAGYLATAELYDPAGNGGAGSWSATGAFTTARSRHTASLLPNGKVIIAGGFNGTALTSAQLYDPAAGTWSATGALVTGHYNHTATLLPNGKMLVAGGAGTSTELYESFAYHVSYPTGTLAFTSSLPSATLLPDGTVLVTPLTTVDDGAQSRLYHPATGTWSVTGALATARYFHTATLLPNGTVLVAGGGGYLASAELYDPAGAWSATGSLATGRYSHTATLLPNGKVLVAGGQTTGSLFLASAELYDPGIGANGTWSATGTLATARYFHTATLLPNGKVLVAGGQTTGSVYLASAELYDPATGTWSATGALATARMIHTATLLRNGKVLVAGGLNANGNGSASAELYDPAAGTWSTTGTLATARSRHTATLLPNGKVLVAGGFNFLAGDNLASAEIYDPTTGAWSFTSALNLANARGYHSATLLPNGNVLVAGGNLNGSPVPTASAELYDFDFSDSYLAAWQPQISSASFDGAGRLVLTGTGFRGISSASGGNGAQDSPTNYPVVQLRRLDNAQSVFQLSHPAVPVSATGFTSVPVAALPLGHALVTVYANGIPSAAVVVVAFPGIAVEQPAGTGIADRGTQGYGTVVGASPVSLIFTIKNPGGLNLTGLTITKDGTHAADFTVTASPAAPVLPGGSTTFTIEFASATSGTKTAAIHIASNVAGKNPYDITLTGQAYSFTQDTDGDGLSDGAEFQYASLGFDWQVSQIALVNTLNSGANNAGLYTPAQVQALNVGVPLIQQNPTTGTFTLTIGVEKSTDLINFNPFPMNAPGTSTVINGPGKLEFQFTVPDNAAFFRLQAQ